MCTAVITFWVIRHILKDMITGL